MIEMCLGNFADAMASRAALARAVPALRRPRARGRRAVASPASSCSRSGSTTTAAAMFAEALDILSRTASRWWRADCLIYAGACELRRGRPARPAR